MRAGVRSRRRPSLADVRPSAITPQLVKAYKTRKLAERESAAVKRPLSNRSINATLRVLAQILDDAVEHGLSGTPGHVWTR
jgi:hypothetical protein